RGQILRRDLAVEASKFPPRAERPAKTGLIRADPPRGHGEPSSVRGLFSTSGRRADVASRHTASQDHPRVCGAGDQSPPPPRVAFGTPGPSPRARVAVCAGLRPVEVVSNDAGVRVAAPAP